MKKVMALLCAALAALFLTAGGPDPDSTRYDTNGNGIWAFTLTLPDSADTTICAGFEYCTGTFWRVDHDVKVQPLASSTRLIADPGSLWTGLPYANPRAGQPLFYWAADSLTSSYPSTVFCCGGGAHCFRVWTFADSASVRIYLSGRCD